jgi:hypothetical protein
MAPASGPEPEEVGLELEATASGTEMQAMDIRTVVA